MKPKDSSVKVSRVDGSSSEKKNTLYVVSNGDLHEFKMDFIEKVTRFWDSYGGFLAEAPCIGECGPLLGGRLGRWAI